MIMDDTAVRGFYEDKVILIILGNRLPYRESFDIILPQGNVHASVYLRKVIYYQLVGAIGPTGRSGLKRQSSDDDIRSYVIIHGKRLFGKF
jgi:hypothetical protein